MEPCTQKVRQSLLPMQVCGHAMLLPAPALKVAKQPVSYQFTTPACLLMKHMLCRPA